MARKKPGSKKKAKKGSIPRHGRPEKHVQADLGLRKFTTDVPLGNNDPTVVQGKLYGGMPNKSRVARGRLHAQRGKRG